MTTLQVDPQQHTNDVARCVVFCLAQPPRMDVVTMQVRPLKQLI